MTPVISVIMPVRNGAEWLGEAVASVRAQEFGDFEFLIVDDGSDDGTAGLLRELPMPTLASVFSASRRWASSWPSTMRSRRHALLIWRSRADDRAKPDVSGGNSPSWKPTRRSGSSAAQQKIDAAGRIIGRLAPPTDGARLARALGRNNPFIHSSVMMRAAMVRSLGGYRAAFKAAEDYDLWLRMTEAGGVANLADDLIQYRQHGSNLSRFDAIRQSFSVRLAQRSAAGRRTGMGDPAGNLTAPPDWWAEEAETTFYAADVGLYPIAQFQSVGWPSIHRRRAGPAVRSRSRRAPARPIKTVGDAARDRRTGRPAASADLDADRRSASRPCARPRMARKIRVIAPPSAGGRDRGAIAPGFM